MTSKVIKAAKGHKGQVLKKHVNIVNGCWRTQLLGQTWPHKAIETIKAKKAIKAKKVKEKFIICHNRRRYYRDSSLVALFTTIRILWQVKTEPGTTADSTSEFRAPEKSPKSPKSEKVRQFSRTYKRTPFYIRLWMRIRAKNSGVAGTAENLLWQ